MTTNLCDDTEMQELVVALQSDGGEALERADRLLAEYPEDPRLHFLRGSTLAGIGRPIEALPALKKAVELAADFAIARFQLGFFQLTSNEPAQALSTWGPLALLPEDNYLRKFVAVSHTSFATNLTKRSAIFARASPPTRKILRSTATCSCSSIRPPHCSASAMPPRPAARQLRRRVFCSINTGPGQGPLA
jgi:tetratricopeptide (TPR) repeat protein